ncbi:MAG: diguanylate cyclase [Planctomycetaceae bacterium]|nr:diguanylate cyclase [Planctomycetaceae bacterium]
MRIMIAEDDCVSRKVLENLLRKWNHEVVVACEGRQAWQMLQQDDAPSMVVLDWMMPGMDGPAICHALRQLPRKIRPYVILLTGRNQKCDLVEGISMGADDFIAKPFDPDELRVRILAGQRIVELQIESLTIMEALRKQASHDYLTGLPNRATILDVLSREFARAPRQQDYVSVAMADIDHFKAINDDYGHAAGDAVLAAVARQMAMTMRSYEYIGRIGGEEFLVVLSGCAADGAAVMGERLRRAVAMQPVAVAASNIPVTISVGIASTSQIDNPTETTLVELADSAMYRAKRAGRNRVESAAEIICCGRP